MFARGSKELPETFDKTRVALEAALRVSEIAASGAPMPEAVQGMVEAAIELLQAEQGSIMLLEDDGQTLTLAASYGLPSEVALGGTIRVGESVAGRVLATGKPLLLGAVDRDAFVNFVPKNRSISSSIVVPLRVQGRGIGVLSLALTDAPSSFGEEDLRVAQMFADQAAALLYRARLHEQAEQRASDLMALVESSRGLLGSLDVEMLLQSVLDGAARLAGSNEGFACLFDGDTGAITRGVFRGFPKEKIRVLLGLEQVRNAIERTDVALFVHPDQGQMVAAGLRTARGSTGVIVVQAEPGTIDERRDLFRAFAQQGGTAIGAAELHGEVERKETELASIIQGVPNPIVLVDARGNIVALNPAFETLFGVSGMFAAGASASETIAHPEVVRMLTDQGKLQGEVIAGNPPRIHKVRVTDVHVPHAAMGRVLIMDDVSSEREIVQTQRDFVAMIGHELRTPLTIIKGFARTLLRRIDTLKPEDAAEALKTIDSRAAQLERLIEDLLYVSKIESREAQLRIEHVDIAALAQAVSHDVIGEHEGREVTIDIPALVWPCDETKVALVLRHLVENALKYSSGPEPVVVRASEDDNDLRIDVIDKGVGMVSSDIPHIFERFHQVDGSSTREQGGTGVGLYLCAQLVRVHNGRIWVDSTWGKGSTFSFSLPRGTVTAGVVRIRSEQAAAEA